MRDPIRRQHEQTTIPEVYGERCTNFRAVRRTRDAKYGLLYIQLGAGWHRFYIDAGLLFWQEGQAPDPEEDLLDGETYVDLADTLAVSGIAVSKIEMEDCRLLLEFENQARLVLQCGVEEDGATALEFVAGAP